MTEDSGPERRDPWRTNAVRINRVMAESPGVNSYDFQFADDSTARQFRFSPGQFNMLYVPGVGEAAISISGNPSPRVLRHTIRNVGAVTDALEIGGVGMTLGLRGPFGKPWPLDEITSGTEPRDILLVAGGIGLAPLRSVITSLIHDRRSVDKISLLMGARTPSDLLYAAEYPAWRQAGVGVQTTVDRATDGWIGHVGVVSLLLDRLAIPNPRSTMLLTCGPEVMMRYAIQAAVQRGIREENSWVALERNMNCAIGLCGHCQLGPTFVCRDGPVFRYDRVAGLLRTGGL